MKILQIFYRIVRKLLGTMDSGFLEFVITQDALVASTPSCFTWSMARVENVSMALEDLTPLISTALKVSKCNFYSIFFFYFGTKTPLEYQTWILTKKVGVTES